MSEYNLTDTGIRMLPVLPVRTILPIIHCKEKKKEKDTLDKPTLTTGKECTWR
jgi:hypothetical protein